MSIDWTKPIRWTKAWQGSTDAELNLHVVAHSRSEAVVAWGCNKDNLTFDVVDMKGRRNGDPFVENVPEEPKDHLCLWCSLDGEWHFGKVSFADYPRVTPVTKAEAEAWQARGCESQKRVIVKVAV